MPKLSKAAAKKTDDAVSTFAPLDEGVYGAKLMDVTVEEGPAGPYWRWEFSELMNVDTGDSAPGRQWLNTSLSENAAWKLKETFEAFGATTDTDTDTLLGSEVLLVISQREIEKGNRQGQIGNQIERVMSEAEYNGR
jgi:hypothetical protein